MTDCRTTLSESPTATDFPLALCLILAVKESPKSTFVTFAVSVVEAEAESDEDVVLPLEVDASFFLFESEDVFVVVFVVSTVWSSLAVLVLSVVKVAEFESFFSAISVFVVVSELDDEVVDVLDACFNAAICSVYKMLILNFCWLVFWLALMSTLLLSIVNTFASELEGLSENILLSSKNTFHICP